MPSVVLLSDLLTAVRERGYMESATTAFSDAKLGRYIQGSCKALYDLILSSYGHEYYATRASVAYTTAGTEGYSLPTDHYKTLGIDLVLTDGRYTSLGTWEIHERNDYGYPLAGIRTGRPESYRLVGAQLWFRPVPNARYAYYHIYVPACPAIGSGSPAGLDSVNGWDEWVVLDALVKIQADQQQDTTGFAQQLAACTARIVSMAPGRAMHSARINRIRNPAQWRGSRVRD